MQSPDGNQLWYPSQSLWSLIAEHVIGAELPKIRTALSNSLVDMYTVMHSEAEMWYKMWQESHQGNNSSRAGTPRPHQQGSPLADPPAIKELVRAEVKMLLQTLRERAGSGVRDCEEVMFLYNPETVDYALEGGYRNCVDPKLSQTENRPSSHCSVRSSAEDEIEAMRDKLNVTDIDQVVDRLRSILTEECEALKRLVKQLKEDIKQRCRSRREKSEPTLAELRELRGALQMDLQLNPSSFAEPPPASSTLPLKELKNRFRLPAGQRFSEETLSTVRRPHPPSVRHIIPRPPSSAPPTKTPASIKGVNSPLLYRIHAKHMGTTASTGPKTAQTPVCTRITSGHTNSHISPSLPGPASEQIVVKNTHLCSPETCIAGLRCRTLSHSLEVKKRGISTIQEDHQSSHGSVHSPGRTCDLLSQNREERKGRPTWRSKKINSITSLTPSLSPQCDAGCYSSNSNVHSASTTGTSKKPRSTTVPVQVV